MLESWTKEKDITKRKEFLFSEIVEQWAMISGLKKSR